MTRIWRVVVVMVVALSLGAFFIVRSDRPPTAGTAAMPVAPEGVDRGSCMVDVGSDPSYRVEVGTIPDLPKTKGTRYLMFVTRDGRPVPGIRVCLTLDMPGMNMEHGQEAREVGQGQYEVPLDLPMAGRWVGEVRVAAPDGPGAVVPVVFEVE